MKLFLIKTLTFFILLMLLFSFRDVFKTTSNLPIDTLQAKLSLLKQSDINYTSFYIGSSYTGDQLNPKIIDSIAGSKSFNLGCALQLNQSKIDFLTLLNNDDIITAGDTVFLEIGLKSITNPKTHKWYYSRKREQYLFSKKTYRKITSDFIQDSSLSFTTKTQLFWLASKTYLNSRSNFHIKSLFYTKSFEIDFESLTHKGKTEYFSNGFTPPIKKRNPKYNASNNSFREWEKSIYKLIDKNDSLLVNSKPDHHLLNSYLNTTAIFKEKGVEIIYVLPHFCAAHLIEAEPLGQLKASLPNLISLNSPSFLLKKNVLNYMYDVTHLNKAGTRLYSELFAQELINYKTNKTR